MMQLFEEELKVQRHLKVSDVTERETTTPHTGRSYCAAKVQKNSDSLDVSRLPFMLG